MTEASTTSTARQYHVTGILGKGGFGTVFLAEHRGAEGFTREVALKVLNREAHRRPEITRRLRDEARLLGMLRHRAIVKVDGLVVLDDRWALVMEYVDGPNLSRVIKQGPMPAGPALEIIAEVASALDVAWTWVTPEGHALELLHRDLKPSNILLTPHGETKVVDFGIARGDFETRETSTRNAAFGSPGYMSPERMDLIDSPAGDIYALGVVLFELLAGRSLGAADRRPKHHSALVEEALTELTEAPPELLDFLRRLLAYEAAQRPKARQVEREAKDLRHRIGGVWLRDWAEQQLPKVPPRHFPAEVHDFNASLLIEAHERNPSANATLSFNDAQAEEVEQVLPTFDPVGEPHQPPQLLSALALNAPTLTKPADPHATTRALKLPPKVPKVPPPRTPWGWMMLVIGALVLIPVSFVVGMLLVAAMYAVFA